MLRGWMRRHVHAQIANGRSTQQAIDSLFRNFSTLYRAQQRLAPDDNQSLLAQLSRLPKPAKPAVALPEEDSESSSSDSSYSEDDSYWIPKTEQRLHLAKFLFADGMPSGNGLHALSDLMPLEQKAWAGPHSARHFFRKVERALDRCTPAEQPRQKRLRFSDTTKMHDGCLHGVTNL